MINPDKDSCFQDICYSLHEKSTIIVCFDAPYIKGADI